MTMSESVSPAFSGPGPRKPPARREVWRGRHVLITGHTGFKGAWLAFWLHRLGARVHGVALDPHTEPALYTELGLGRLIDDRRCDIRDLESLEAIVREVSPEVIFHLAARPIVQEAYADPPAAFHTNVQGSVNVFECARRAETVRVLIHVSSDKCYLPDPSGGPYAEDHPLGGDDPYSASKAAAELAFLSYLRTLFPAEGRVKAASVRAGNVIGGGDWASDRILPDAARALSRGAPVPVRNPRHTRPWQHVLDALSGYLLLAERLLAGEAALCGAWNFGPDTDDEHPVAELVEKFAAAWGGGNWVPADRRGSGPETARLRLDSSRARRILGWRPRWDFDAAVRRTARWYRDFYSGESARELCLRDLDAHETGGGTEP